LWCSQTPRRIAGTPQDTDIDEMTLKRMILAKVGKKSDQELLPNRFSTLHRKIGSKLLTLALH
jgi:hypothetical protein